ncbi:MAG TPA: phytanoyl-CoA dioxygenase family protein [Pseudonocardia sp.]|jgi:ectoine hydroxylase-related dioxygenase (phytanoyl-CoA dioxygenase family)|nr:phytanoyl-CoA dioxygenase family protein [Pseudonocardia sp.]
MSAPTRSGNLRLRDCRLADLEAVLAERTDPADYPHADGVEQQIVVYTAEGLGAAPDTELAAVLADGPGVIAVRGAFDPSVVQRASEAFQAIIDQQRASGVEAGDHFARPGSNDRIWEALGKLALHDPDTFVDYYSNTSLARVCRAWLGPDYQVTSQPNVVNPGGGAQVGHRDYHLGFLPAVTIERYPEHVHRLSPVLTLQGAVAHSDMPLETGPTCYLPHSQKYLPGYLATERPEFREYFDTHHRQLPLRTGDAVFFNPAVIHGAGANRTRDIRRMANLLQVSSAFGRAMEAVDRVRASAAVYPALLARRDSDPDGVDRAVAAVAEGYPFPTNLDRDPPLDGLAPLSQADLVRTGLAAGWSPDRMEAALAEQTGRRAPGAGR